MTKQRTTSTDIAPSSRPNNSSASRYGDVPVTTESLLVDNNNSLPHNKSLDRKHRPRHHHHHHYHHRRHDLQEPRDRSSHSSIKRSRSFRRSSSKCSTDDQTRKRYKYHSDEASTQNIVSRVWQRNPKFSALPLEWWERTPECKEAKIDHVDKIDRLCSSREFLVLETTLLNANIALEPNMFPYECPRGIEHFTLWSRNDLTHHQVVDFVDQWLTDHFPEVRRWQYDDNLGERSILLFHVHVFVEMLPFSFSPRPGQEYFAPHMLIY